ncbi:MAG: excinuclease ABC subunit UvrC, partial [Myxococcales bacterium]|nr:excinuclease ABC subunit UvrC [Myxococcales bacterium]
ELLKPDEDYFKTVPTSPGVYIMKAAGGDVVYVGKAKNLRLRLRQYFRPGNDTRFFVAAGLLERVLVEIETMLVDNEKEALLLENHLIKKHRPRFNVKLRDDKQYLVLRINPKSDYPRVEVVRNIKDDDARYFGPYHSATSCRSTLRTLNRHFQLRTCTDHVLKSRNRVCLQYQIKRCPGPCVHDVSETTYGEQVDDVMMFLGGKNKALLARLKERMFEKSAGEEFEAAAQLRDSMMAVDKSLARQNVVQEDFVDQDIFGLWRRADVVEVVVLFVRSGKLVGKRAFRQRDQAFPDAQVMESFVQQYYEMRTVIPNEVLLPEEIESKEVLAEWLSELRGKKVSILWPQRGQKVRLIELANKNAAASAMTRKGRDDDKSAGLEKLAKRLSLRKTPDRIECFDIAHIQGTDTVASMVVFREGEADKDLYRKFKVKTVQNDDFGAMHEVLTRRFKRALAGDSGWEFPDLLVIDGGKGQLSSALAAISDLGIELGSETGFDVVGLAKERDDTSGTSHPDRVFLRRAKDAIQLRANTAELFVLAQLRDEAHRFANTFHKQQRKKRSLRSEIDEIGGIGPKRRKALLRSFGSVKAISGASLNDLADVESMTQGAAEAVFAHFRNKAPKL